MSRVPRTLPRNKSRLARAAGLRNTVCRVGAFPWGNAMKPPVWASTAGFLIGLVLVWWLRPETTEGAALVIIVCTALLTLGGIIVQSVRGRKAPPAGAEDGK